MPETPTTVRRPGLSALSPDPGVAQAIDNTDSWWRDGAERALLQLAATGRTFDAGDLRDEPYAIPDPDHPSRWGGLFAGARARGWIEPVGYTRSRTRSRRYGSVMRWRGRPPAAA